MQDDPAATTKVIVGLGNPGEKYAGTRHNVGFMVVKALASRWGADRGRKAFGGRLQDVRLGGAGADDPPRRVMLMRPMTYMNNSGRAVRDLTSFYRIPPNDVLIVMDDLALPPGRLRFRPGGSAGGHKGLSDIAAAIGTEAIARLRIGIGSPPEPMDAADYVLRRFDKDETDAISQAVDLAARAAEEWLSRPMAELMTTYNAPRQERKSADESTNQDV